MTRLADLTGLDRIGFPVWQAVRPAGRAQSVHQGKGSSPLAAQIGALGEALESHWAEQLEPEGIFASWEELPPDHRSLDRRDFYKDGADRADPGRIEWCKCADLRSGAPIYLPHLFVSLDFTLPTNTVFERSSAGLAVGTCEEEAVETALLEVLERDALGSWRRMSASEKAECRLDMKSIPFSWFKEWQQRVRAAGAHLRVFATEAVDGSPVCIVYLGGTETFGSAQRLFRGTAAHGLPEIALFKAMAEALQSRLTFIAGTRDDMLPSLYNSASPAALLGGAGYGRARKEFGRIMPMSSAPHDVAERLARIGYDKVAVKRLDGQGCRVPVVKVAVPSLGSLHRRRRLVQ